MAVRQKRLFWMSLIVVELVLLYIVWRPHRDRFIRSPHRIAIAPPVVPRPESKPTAIVIVPRKPLKATRSNVPAPGRPPIVNASLKSPEPIPAKSVPVPQTPLSPLESFWCHMAMMESNCDCKVRSNERANILVR
jgi:hypothetical protein